MRTTNESFFSRPHLVWVIQNFHLRHTTEIGEESAVSQWIERVLARIDQRNNGTTSYRSQFNEFFLSLHVKTLPFPVRDVNDLKNLSALPATHLNPDYLDYVQQIRKYIQMIAKPKRMGTLKMSGMALARLVEKWAENVNAPAGSYGSDASEELLMQIM